MLKKRIGAALIIKDDWVVQSIGFKKYLPVGRPEIAVEFLNQWGVDEIIMMDISARKNQKVVSAELLARSARYCRVPLAVGGGITTVEEMELLLQNGADKICMNHILLSDPSILTKGAQQFGEQCMVGVIDFITGTSGYEVYDYNNKKTNGRDVISYALELQEAGAGELLLQSVERDGAYSGFEIPLYTQISEKLSIPVIALGGAGSPFHFAQLLHNSGVSAACAGNFFHFTEHSVTTLKSQLLHDNNTVRLETHANYDNSSFDKHGRLLKADDQYLEDLLYVRIEKEEI